MINSEYPDTPHDIGLKILGYIEQRAVDAFDVVREIQVDRLQERIDEALVFLKKLKSHRYYSSVQDVMEDLDSAINILKGV